MTEKEEKKSRIALIASRTAPLKARPKNQEPEDANDK